MRRTFKVNENCRDSFLKHTLILKTKTIQQYKQRKLKVNTSFPSFIVPLFQIESSWKTFHMKMILICIKMNLRGITFSWEWFGTKARFDTEAKRNSKMVYWRGDGPQGEKKKLANFWHTIISLYNGSSIENSFAKKDKQNTRRRKIPSRCIHKVS